MGMNFGLGQEGLWVVFDQDIHTDSLVRGDEMKYVCADVREAAPLTCDGF